MTDAKLDLRKRRKEERQGRKKNKYAFLGLEENEFLNILQKCYMYFISMCLLNYLQITSQYEKALLGKGFQIPRKNPRKPNSSYLALVFTRGVIGMIKVHICSS